MTKKSSFGRPKGRKKTAKIEVMIEPEIKERFMTVLSESGETASVKLGCWIIQYLKERDGDHYA